MRLIRGTRGGGHIAIGERSVIVYAAPVAITTSYKDTFEFLNYITIKLRRSNTTQTDVDATAVAPLVNVGIEFPLALADLDGTPELDPDGIVELTRA